MVARVKIAFGVSLHLLIIHADRLPLFSAPSMRLGVEDHEVVKLFIPFESYPTGPCVEDHVSQ